MRGGNKTGIRKRYTLKWTTHNVLFFLNVLKFYDDYFNYLAVVSLDSFISTAVKLSSCIQVLTRLTTKQVLVVSLISGTHWEWGEIHSLRE